MALVLNEPTSNRFSALSLATSRAHSPPLVLWMHFDTRVSTRARAHARLVPSRPVQYRLVPRSEPARSSFHSTVSRLEHRESIEKRISGRSLVNYIPSKVERLYSRIVRDRSNQRTNEHSLDSCDHRRV